jgi:hypothetical protein
MTQLVQRDFQAPARFWYEVHAAQRQKINVGSGSPRALTVAVAYSLSPGDVRKFFLTSRRTERCSTGRRRWPWSRSRA